MPLCATGRPLRIDDRPEHRVRSTSRRLIRAAFWSVALVGSAGDAVAATTAVVGGRGGLSRYNLDCLSKEALVGIHGNAGAWLNRIGAKCVEVSAEGNWVGSPVKRVTAGGAGGTDFDWTCPSGFAVTGIKGRQGTYIDRLEVQCRKLSGRWRATGPTVALAAVGGAGGTPFGPLSCPSGVPATGAWGNSGLYVDSIALKCDDDPWRPAYHFHPGTGWMNDPAGLVHAGGLYHLYYQAIPGFSIFNPQLPSFDPKAVVWGHATSQDLVHWTDRTNSAQTAPLRSETEGLEKWTPFTGSGIVLTGAAASAPPCSCTPGASCVAAFFTQQSHTTFYQRQAVAASCDGGSSFRQQADTVLENPEFPLHPHARDPKVFWYQKPRTSAGWWVKVLAAGDRIKIYNSSNLTQWSHRSDVVLYGSYNLVGPFVETPDLVELRADQDPDGGSRWVLLFGEGFIPHDACEKLQAVPVLRSLASGCRDLLNPPSRGMYLVGDFDGESFVATKRPPEAKNPGWPLDSGPDFYAPQTWIMPPRIGAPRTSGRTVTGRGEAGIGLSPAAPALPRRILIGWQNNWRYAHLLPTTDWRGHASIPRELGLVYDAGKKRHLLLQQPAMALGSTATRILQQANVGLSPMPYSPSVPSTAFVADMTIDVTNAAGVEVFIRAASPPPGMTLFQANRPTVKWMKTGGHLTLHRPAGAAPETLTGDYLAELPAPANNLLKLKILVDRSSVEVFGGDGRAVLSGVFFPNPGHLNFAVSAQGAATLKSLDVWDFDR